MQTTRLATAPVATRERVAALDALRGVAVLGILVINIDALSGFAFTPESEHAGQPLARWDRAVWLTLATLVEAKFYSVFSFLFGVGFAVFAQRAVARGADPRRLFKRRLIALTAIGLAHAVFIWHGDILATYGVLGFALLPFLTRDDRSLLTWAGGMLVLPIVLYALLYVVASAIAPSAPAPPPSGSSVGLPAFLLTAADRLAHGNYLDVVRGNVAFASANVVRRLLLMFFPRVLGMFLLGFWAGRRKLFNDVARHRRLFESVAMMGFAIGLPLSAVGAWWGEHAVGPPNAAAVFETVVRSIAVPALALAYAAALPLLFLRFPALTAALAPVGRMALTNYLLHSVAGVLVFTSLGLGLFGRVSLTAAVLGAVAFFVLQIFASRAWFTRAQFGPAEWLWRCITYGQRFPLLKPS